MRKHNAPLGKWGQALYRTGLKSRRLRRNSSAEELRKLHEACQNAERIPKLEERSRRLFYCVAHGTFSSADWDEFVRVKKASLIALQRLEMDAKRYGWTAPDLPCLPCTEVPDEMIASILPGMFMDVSAADIPVYPAPQGLEGAHGG